MRGSAFAFRVLQVVASIPKGKCLSYGDVAKRAGHPGAPRAVGTIMSRNTDPSVPCHRVVHADGRIGEYNGLKGEKRAVLKKEGTKLVGKDRVDPSCFEW